MKSGMRSALVLVGLSLVYAAFLVLVGKPLLHLPGSLPPVTVSRNVPYFLFVRFIQWLFQFHGASVMLANGLLMLATFWLMFRVGWGIAKPPYSLEAATAAMILFEFNPLVIVMPLTLGFLGGVLWVPLLMLVFISMLIQVENWSVFMRAIVLAVVWSFFLWVHLPTALFVLAAFVPWLLYNRRPLPALGLFVTIFTLGSILFTLMWTVGCALARRWSLKIGRAHV